MWRRLSTISLDGYGSKIWKVSRCRLAVQYGTILATKQEFFFAKLIPMQSITGIVLLVFLFIFLFQWIRYSNVVICFFGWEIGHSLSTWATEGMEEGHPKCVQLHTGGEGYHASCVPTHLQAITLFKFLS